MGKKIKIGILGCGPRGLQMGHIVNLLPEVCELRAMSDTAPEALDKAAVFSSAKLFDNSDALLEEGGVDAVITEVPPAYHTEYVCKALTRGIHVLGEIPAVDSIEEGERLWQVVNANEALYMCASCPITIRPLVPYNNRPVVRGAWCVVRGAWPSHSPLVP